MTQSNVVELNKIADLIDLVDIASKYAKQAQGALTGITANEEFEKLNNETIDLVLWAVAERLEDLENLFTTQNFCDFETNNKGAKLAGQAMQIIIAYQDGDLLKIVNKEIVSNALWLVADKIDEILNLISSIKLK